MKPTDIRLIVAIALGWVALLDGCATATPGPTAAPTEPLPTVAPTQVQTAVTLPTDIPAPEATEPATQTPTEAASPAPTQQDVVITYQDFEIVPSQISLPAGTRVLFLIKSASGAFHQPYNFDAPNTFESPAQLGEGATYAHTFSESGTTTIRCGYHANMVSTVNVTP